MLMFKKFILIVLFISSAGVLDAGSPALASSPRKNYGNNPPPIVIGAPRKSAQPDKEAPAEEETVQESAPSEEAAEPQEAPEDNSSDANETAEQMKQSLEDIAGALQS